jgi:hypothetical protein
MPVHVRHGKIVEALGYVKAGAAGPTERRPTNG